MSRIRETFASLKRAARGGFIPFITAGDPDLTTTERLLIELAAAGANIIELGVPFSDPVADGDDLRLTFDFRIQGSSVGEYLYGAPEIQSERQGGKGLCSTRTGIGSRNRNGRAVTVLPK